MRWQKLDFQWFYMIKLRPKKYFLVFPMCWGSERMLLLVKISQLSGLRKGNGLCICFSN